MVKVEYLVNHGSYKKGDTRELPKSTAEALAAHKVVKVAGKKEDKE